MCHIAIEIWAKDRNRLSREEKIKGPIDMKMHFLTISQRNGIEAIARYIFSAFKFT